MARQDQQGRGFCTVCRKETSSYTLQKRNVEKTINGKHYTFNITVAICDECGEEMSVPGLIDQIIKEMDEQYRACEDIITIAEIKRLVDMYNIGEKALSRVLGFKDQAITYYLAGQVPSKQCSDIMKKALSSPVFVTKKLNANKI